MAAFSHVISAVYSNFGLLMSFVYVYTHNAASTGIALCSTGIDFVTVVRHCYFETRPIYFNYP